MAQLVKNLPAIAGDRDTGSIPEWERSPGEEKGAPIQYSCLENPKDREAWQAAVCGIAKSQIQLSAHTHTTHKLIQAQWEWCFNQVQTAPSVQRENRSWKASWRKEHHI